MDRLQRRAKRDSLWWFGPDEDVNLNRGGNAELHHLLKLVSVVDVAENAATIEELTAPLSAGRWCHFRGHGKWTGSVHTSGLKMAEDRVFCSEHYRGIAGAPGFLFTAACLTGFAEAVGVEAFGSLVDYDRAGLLGAVLTNWPIHGNAATVFTSLFYEELRRGGDAAHATKVASQRCRVHYPHPYVWAPFSLLGAWLVGDLVRWR
jgi:CHAT domain-containing protein